MSDPLKEVMQESFESVRFDQSLCTKLMRLDVNFINKNQEHAEFFGQGAIGIHRVNFTSTDRDDFFADLFSIDETILQTKIEKAAMLVQAEYEVKRKKDKNLKKPSFDPGFENSQDPFNLACIYIVHRLNNVATVKKEVLRQAQISVLNYLFYSFLTSLIKKYYPYPPDPDIARAVYSSLSAKYLIKQLGTWQELVKYRSLAVLEAGSIWTDVIANYNDCDRVVQCVNDLKGRMNSHVNEITALFHKLHKQGTKLNTNSATYMHDGEKILKEADKGQSAYTTYILQVIPDKSSFVKGELIDAVVAIMPTCTPRILKDMLMWYSGNYTSLQSNHPLKSSVEAILEHAYIELSEDPKMLSKSKDLAGLLIKFKGIYTASKSSNEDLLKLRDSITAQVTLVTGTKDYSRACSVRTGIMLYILARTFTMQAYNAH